MTSKSSKHSQITSSFCFVLLTCLLVQQMLTSKENPGWPCRKHKRRIVHGVILMTLCLVLMGFIAGKFETFLDSILRLHDVAQQDQRINLLNPYFQEEDATSGFNVLVVGDWGRLGLYNQSAVAEQVRMRTVPAINWYKLAIKSLLQASLSHLLSSW